MRRIECRAASLRAVRHNVPRVAGYAAVWDAPSEGLGFTEFVRRGAFTRTLAAGGDVLGLFHHDPRLVLGSRTAGTLRLAEDATGLAFEIDVPDTAAGRDVLISVERGDVRGASFAFDVPADGDRITVAGDQVVRELLDVNLFDVTVTPMPAYPATAVGLRRRPPAAGTPRLAAARRFLQTV